MSADTPTTTRFVLRRLGDGRHGEVRLMSTADETEARADFDYIVGERPTWHLQLSREDVTVLATAEPREDDHGR